MSGKENQRSGSVIGQTVKSKKGSEVENHLEYHCEN